MEAYVYIHRSTTQTDGSTKVGSHTGTLQKLWARYKTYTGSQQEFKVFATHPDDVVATERYIQSQLDQNGLWLENERFKPQAWTAFDMHARECLQSDDTMKSVQLSDKMLTVTDIQMDAVNEVPSDTSFLNYRTLESLTYRVFAELKSQNLYRIEGSGDIVKRHNELPYWYDHVSTARDFINQVCGDIPKYFSSPNYLTAMVRTLKTVMSTQSPFITIDYNAIGYKNGILRITNLHFTPLPQTKDISMQSRFYFDQDYKSDDATAVFDDFMNAQFEDNEEVKKSFMVGLGRLLFPSGTFDDKLVMNVHGEGKDFVREFLKHIFGPAKIAFIVNGERYGDLRKHELIIIDEALGIDVSHPINCIESFMQGDILQGDSEKDIIHPFVTPFILFSDKTLNNFSPWKRIVPFELRSYHDTCPRSEVPSILHKCLITLHNSEFTYPSAPESCQGQLTKYDTERPPNILQEFIKVTLRHDPNNRFGVSLKLIRGLYREYLLLRNLGHCYSSSPMNRTSIMHLLNQECIPYQPKSCKSCGKTFTKGTKCCASFKKRSLSDHIRYCSLI